MRQDDERFDDREARADADAWARSKRDVLEPADLGLCIGRKARVIERVRIVPQLAMAVDEPRIDHDQIALSNVVTARYVYGPGVDSPLTWYAGAGTADRRWLIPDERGSIVAVTDASGNAIAVNAYDEYGIPAPTNLGRFQYTGQAWLPEIGMYYYKARIYAPTLGRFMQSDPIGYRAGMNRYSYVTGDPINFRDPTGLHQYCSLIDDSHVVYGPDGDVIENVVSSHYYCFEVSENALIDLPYFNTDDLGISSIYDFFDDTIRDISCRASSSIRQYQESARGTLQVGLAASGSAGPVSGLFGYGGAIDASGNIAFYGYGGPAIGAGLSGEAGLSVQGSNAKSVNDLSGLFINSSVHLGAGAGGSVDYFTGPSSNGQVSGAGVTLGAAAGAAASVGGTYTVVAPIGNPINSLASLLGSGC